MRYIGEIIVTVILLVIAVVLFWWIGSVMIDATNTGSWG